MNIGKAIIQIQDSPISYDFSGNDWIPDSKNVAVSRYFDGRTYQMNYYSYDPLNFDWNKTYGVWYLHVDITENIREYLEKPYNSFINDWNQDTSYFYSTTGRYSKQFYGYICSGRQINKSYELTTNQFSSGYATDYSLYNDTLYKEIKNYYYDVATEVYKLSAKTVFEYDANNYRQKETSYNFDAVNNTFVNNNRHYYIFLGGNNNQSVEQVWNGVEWLNNDKDVYVYDANGRVLTERNDDWTGSAGSYSSKYTYTYDANGHALGYLHLTWDNVGSVWVNYSQSIYTNDANGNNLSYVNQIWDSGTSTWVNNYRNDYTYDANNNKTQYLEASWDNVGSVWNYYYKVKYFWSSYDANTVSDFLKPRYNIFPNPSDGLLQIDARGSEYEKIIITDMNGKVIFNEKGSIGQTINMRQYGSGIYNLQIIDFAGEACNTKIVVR